MCAQLKKEEQEEIAYGNIHTNRTTWQKLRETAFFQRVYQSSVSDRGWQDNLIEWTQLTPPQLVRLTEDQKVDHSTDGDNFVKT